MAETDVTWYDSNKILPPEGKRVIVKYFKWHNGRKN